MTLAIPWDISGCFDAIDHDVMLAILSEKIHDNRFLRLVRNMLKAGYLEDWKYHESPSGTPQGGVVSPILSNIYLHKLDRFIEEELIPRHTRGGRRRRNPEYTRVQNQRWNAKRRGDRAHARELLCRLRSLPSADPVDPGFRRLRYTRFADDHLLGFIGPRAEAEKVRTELAEFLRETLHLELNQDKTLITRARTQRARFLGYDITVPHGSTKVTRGRRSVNGRIALLVPPDVVKAKCAPYRQHGKPWHRNALLNLDDYDIVRTYGAEYRGIVNYYLLAQNVYRLGALRWNAELSMLETLASKHRSTVAATAARHKAKIETSKGLRTCIEARKQRPGKKDLIARFGGIPLRRDSWAVMTDPAPVHASHPRKELIARLGKRECELCEQGRTVSVHQIAKLADLGKPGPGQPAWAKLMAQMRRKTLIVCAACHEHTHATPVTHAA
jgi:hypothetical protein